VFVLATTDPQKVSETIRSRTQHLEFHLLPSSVLDEHVRWLIDDAGLAVEPDAIDAILRQGGGSARDTISALELVVAAGGAAPEEAPLDEFVESLIESDPGRALAAVASSINQGRDPRMLTESLLAHLRDCFLSLMAPELVALPDRRAEEVGALAQRLGAAAAVRAMETLGTILVEMRHAPDPRVLLEVALVKLTAPAADSGVGALARRVDKLEQALATGAGVASSAAGTAGTADTTTPTPAPPPARPGAGRAALGSRASAPRPAPPPVEESVDEPTPASAPAPEPAPAAATAAAGPSAAPAPAPTATPQPGPAPQGAGESGSVEQAWPSVLQALKPVAKARLAAGHIVGDDGNVVRIAFPSAAMVARADEVRGEIEQALQSVLGRPRSVELAVGDGPPDTTGPAPAPQLSDEHEVDLDSLVDAPKVEPTSNVDRITAAFPGATLVDEEP
jgi:DNA polymerase-3 subunit gamma/tau